MSKFSLGVWNHGPALADRVCYVSPSFNYSEGLRQFNKIQDAIDWIYNDSGWYSSLGNSNHAVIYVYPGTYIEQLDSKKYIQIVGIAGANVLRYQAVKLHNTGQTEATYPFKTTTGEQLILDGFSVTTDQGGIYGEVQSAEFHNCSFRLGKFIETQRTEYQEMSFKDSMFFANSVSGYEYFFDLSGVRGRADNWITFEDCWFGEGRIKAHSTHASSTSTFIQIIDCELKHGIVDIGGDWGFICSNMHSFGDALGRNVFSTTSSVNIQSSTIANGIHFTSVPSQISIANSTFFDNEGFSIPAGQGDITSDVVLPSVKYSQNSQYNGLDGEVQYIDPIKPVGAYSINGYRTIQEAIDSIVLHGTVELQEDLTGLSPLSLATNQDIIIDGLGAHSLTFTTNIVTLNASETLKLRNLSGLNGQDMELNGAGSMLTIELCPSVTGHIKITNGNKVSLCRSGLVGSTGSPAITVSYANTDVEVGYSTVKGSAANPAMLFTVDADLKLKAKFDTFIHGSGSTNAPLQRTGTYTIDFSAYNCASNVRLDQPPGFNNVIVSGNNTIDTSINF